MGKTNCYSYCPKCGQVYANVVGATKTCLECGTTMVNLPPEFDEMDYHLEDEDGNEIYGFRNVIFELYVKDNPMYNEAAHQRMLASNAILHNNGTAGKAKCPVCQSTNLSRISAVGKVAKIAAFGIFGMGDSGKTWKCNQCGSRF